MCQCFFCHRDVWRSVLTEVKICLLHLCVNLLFHILIRHWNFSVFRIHFQSVCAGRQRPLLEARRQIRFLETVAHLFALHCRESPLVSVLRIINFVGRAISLRFHSSDPWTLNLPVYFACLSLYLSILIGQGRVPLLLTRRFISFKLLLERLVVLAVIGAEAERKVGPLLSQYLHHARVFGRVLADMGLGNVALQRQHRVLLGGERRRWRHRTPRVHGLVNTTVEILRNTPSLHK